MTSAPKGIASTLALTIGLGLGLGLGSAAAAQDSILRMATSFAIESMDPVSEGFWLQEFGSGELMMRYEPDGSIVPWLAESLETVDDTTWVLTIRDGVTFQNGKPMDVAAVLAAFDYHRQNNAGTAAALGEALTFEETGPREITIRTGTPLPELPSILAHESRLMVIDVETVLAAGDDYESLEGAGIHTGPYKVMDLDSQRMISEAYAGYWQGTPAMDGLELYFVSDENARTLAVQNGEVDIALYPPVAAKPVFDATPGVNLVLGPLSSGGFLGYMNVSDGPLTEVPVRQAVMKAINYEEIAETIFHGTKAAPTGLYNPDLAFAVENYEYDTEEAAALLDAAGWVLEGSQRMRDGEALAITMLIYPQQPDLIPMTGAMQVYFNELGIASDIVSVDDLTEATMSGTVEWDLALASNGTSSVGAVAGILQRYLITSGSDNYGGYSNAEIDALVDEIYVTVDPEARNALIARVQEILVEEDPYMFTVTQHRERALVSDAWITYEPAVAWNHVKFDTAPAE
ncbi:ABC transporter substrate-binding protein [Pseudoroseicyclus sp. CXY001]|uniref:ABC transporter substrate-binding protein n=1 Tax=Pseudoroseicyclus sp. CXY001 TaxID=3242492 RepID=UPI0035709F7D